MNIRLCEDIFFIYAIHFQGKRTPLDRRGTLNEMKGRQFDSITVFSPSQNVFVIKSLYILKETSLNPSHICQSAC